MTKQKIYDILERALNTWWQAALMFIIASQSLDQSVLGAAALAGLPALFNFLYRLIAGVQIKVTNLWLDLISRGGITFLSTFLGLLAAGGLDYTSSSTWTAALVSAGTTAIALLKGGAASLIKGTVTPASLLPVPKAA